MQEHGQGGGAVEGQGEEPDIAGELVCMLAAGMVVCFTRVAWSSGAIERKKSRLGRGTPRALS